MSSLPDHGRVACELCHLAPVVFDQTRTVRDNWRITANPLAWGNSAPEIVILGFSKGPNALGALASRNHNDIAYSGQRLAVAKILAHIGLLPKDSPDSMRAAVEREICNVNGRFAWGSLIRCTVERFDKGDWKSSGGGMLDKFVATDFGRSIATNCVRRHLGALPERTKLVVLFGLGTKLGYVAAARQLFQNALGVVTTSLNEVAYKSERLTFVHVEHFAAQGHLIPDWLGEPSKKGGISPRARFGIMARDAVQTALTC